MCWYTGKDPCALCLVYFSFVMDCEERPATNSNEFASSLAFVPKSVAKRMITWLALASELSRFFTSLRMTKDPALQQPCMRAVYLAKVCPVILLCHITRGKLSHIPLRYVINEDAKQSHTEEMTEILCNE